MTRPDAAVAGPAADLIDLCREHGLSLGVAESLTGGAVCSRLIEVPGASAVVRGGVVAYATDRKAAVLGVPGELLAREGAVDADVARAMAGGACTVMGADVGLATTGVAGPEPQDGKPVGLVFVAVVGPGVDEVREIRLQGDRAAIREASVEAVLGLACDLLRLPNRHRPTGRVGRLPPACRTGKVAWSHDRPAT